MMISKDFLEQQLALLPQELTPQIAITDKENTLVTAINDIRNLLTAYNEGRENFVTREGKKYIPHFPMFYLSSIFFIAFGSNTTLEQQISSVINKLSYSHYQTKTQRRRTLPSSS
jgi:hypothetical protein